MKTRRKKEQLTLYSVIVENRRTQEDLRILRALVKEKKEGRWHQHRKVQPQKSVGGACGAIAAGISPFSRRNTQFVDLTAIVL